MRLDRFLTVNMVRPLRRALHSLSSCDRDQEGERKATFEFKLGTRNSSLPILMYHSISDTAEPNISPYYRICTNPRRFRQHMGLLKSEGYQGVTLTAGLSWLNAPLDVRCSSVGGSKHSKPVVLTFDDGLHDFYTAAYPILKEFSFTATMFLPTAFISGSEGRRAFCPGGRSRHAARAFQLSTCHDALTWSEVLELRDAGIEFGSHTVSHPRLVELSWPEIESEISNSKSQIEQRLGAPAPAFAYPYAFPQADKNFAEAFRQLLYRVGYESCVTTEVGRARPGTDQFRLSRLPVNSDDDEALLQAKLDGDYDWLAFPQAIVKKIKHAVHPARKKTDDTVQTLISRPNATASSPSLSGKQT